MTTHPHDIRHSLMLGRHGGNPHSFIRNDLGSLHARIAHRNDPQVTDRLHLTMNHINTGPRQLRDDTTAEQRHAVGMRLNQRGAAEDSHFLRGVVKANNQKTAF